MQVISTAECSNATFLWIISVIYVLCLSCFHVCSLLPCGHLKGRTHLLALVCDVYCDGVSSPFGILGHVYYLIVSIPDPCCLSYFYFTMHRRKQLDPYQARQDVRPDWDPNCLALRWYSGKNFNLHEHSAGCAGQHEFGIHFKILPDLAFY